MALTTAATSQDNLKSKLVLPLRSVVKCEYLPVQLQKELRLGVLCGVPVVGLNREGDKKVSVNDHLFKKTSVDVLPNEADDELAGPVEEGEEVTKEVSEVTIECTVIRWDGIDQHYIVKCVETHKYNTVDSNNGHELVNKSCEDPVKHLRNKVVSNFVKPSYLIIGLVNNIVQTKIIHS